MQEEMADLMEDSKEIQDVLSKNYDVSEDVTESDLEAGMFLALKFFLIYILNPFSSIFLPLPELDAFELEETELDPALLDREMPSFVDADPIPELEPMAKDTPAKETTAL